MSARDDYPADGAIGGTAELRDGLYDKAMDEIDRLRDHVTRLRIELSRHGWGDFHYGDQPQDPRIVALLAEIGPEEREPPKSWLETAPVTKPQGPCRYCDSPAVGWRHSNALGAWVGVCIAHGGTPITVT